MTDNESKAFSRVVINTEFALKKIGFVKELVSLIQDFTNIHEVSETQKEVFETIINYAFEDLEISLIHSNNERILI
jgi:hypothetical protein